MKTISIFAALLLCLGLSAQTIDYKGTSVTLGPKALLVDGSLSDSQAATSPYIFNDFNAATRAAIDGTPAEPMRIYIAPWVYWVNDPDDPNTPSKTPQGGPYGLVIRCQSLQLLGLSKDPQDVVLACARGQSQGSIGNYTMFEFWGDDIVVKDLTMGNYCNIDLVYPRNPALNRAKRNPAITQAQIAFCHGDRYYAENVRFMARLNLMPLYGPKRAFYLNCHMECTDDALTSTGVFLGCEILTWGRQPFAGADRYGAILLDSDIHICHDMPVQALSKMVSRFSIVDVRYHAGRPVQLDWCFRPEEWQRCYQYGTTLDGAPAFVGAAKPYNTVVLEQKGQLAAYRLTDDEGKVLYNTYNLLRGEDDWDPQGIKSKVEALSKRDGRDYGSIATCLDLSRRSASLRTGEGSVSVKATLMRNLGYELKNQKILWRVQSGYERFVSLSAAEGPEITITPTNSEDLTRNFNVFAYTADGLDAAIELTVAPDLVAVPAFVREPSVKIEGGVASVDYELDLQGRRDESEITWYRCDKASGAGAVAVSVSNGKPRSSYKLSAGDAGKYIMAGVAPKHLRCNAGPEVKAVAKKAISKKEVPASQTIDTDFSDFPCAFQAEVRPGYWSVDAFKPSDTGDGNFRIDPSRPAWFYGTGINGAKGVGIQQLQMGARLRYTPLKGKYGDMSVVWQVDPAKDEGQGFSMAGPHYLDVFIKFDTQTLTGYALRLVRTTKYANAVDALLVKYTKGVIEPVTEGVSTDCFLTGCVLSVKYEAGVLSARVEGPGRIAKLANDPNIHHTVELSAKVEPNDFGGIGMQHTSGAGDESRIMVHTLHAEWK